MSEPSSADLIRAVARWQADDAVHPLTCGVDSRHPPLVAEEETGVVFLVCVTEHCHYSQALEPDTPLAALLLSHA